MTISGWLTGLETPPGQSSHHPRPQDLPAGADKAMLLWPLWPWSDVNPSIQTSGIGMRKFPSLMWISSMSVHIKSCLTCFLMCLWICRFPFSDKSHWKPEFFVWCLFSPKGPFPSWLCFNIISMFMLPKKHLNSDQNPGWLGYIEDYTTHLYPKGSMGPVYLPTLIP